MWIVNLWCTAEQDSIKGFLWTKKNSSLNCQNNNIWSDSGHLGGDYDPSTYENMGQMWLSLSKVNQLNEMIKVAIRRAGQTCWKSFDFYF